ncbi:VWA domain-containing protein [Shewanella sp. SG41-4]|uniref:VIT domain-containing protein n=1 Tax=Shewanella sp. SG41-4 TaxID=2760976 RepID=UPI00160454D9|nr:VIT domain-containing protein [Shewanella sp. SG41-4]MBB1438398.1 VWA domain-containing protein [Shewanella sp. SG41-4]
MNSKIGLTTLSGELIALRSVDITAKLTGVLSEVEIKQHYQNSTTANIETVYTFPLPIDAVLTSLEVEINGELLQGRVKANRAAEDDYEDAIVNGDTAVLLSKISDGLYCINLGNLLAGEAAVITFRYAQLHQWQGERLRFYLPTTIAPKYGTPQLTHIAEHQLPQHSLSATYKLTFSISIEGLLAGTAIHCPSHSVAHQVVNQIMNVSLNRPQVMDRDFILELEKPKGYVGEGYWADDGEHTVALTSFIPTPESTPESKPETAPQHDPRCIKIVVDCSGSMAGDSIKQARIALIEVVNQLETHDYFNIILFGSRHQKLFEESVLATAANIKIAQKTLRSLEANLGGTEMKSALEAAYRSHSPIMLPTDLLLITDGQTWKEDEVLTGAALANHRHFVIGVGSAVSEAFLSKLAKVTGGASDFVTPNEAMSTRIVQHFKRMKQPPLQNPQLCLSDKYAAPLCFNALPAHKNTLFLGDTVNLFTLYEGYPAAVADLYYEGEFNEAEKEHEVYGSTIAITHKDNDKGLLARLAAHDRLSVVSEDEALEIAEKYQLITKSTSYILVKTNAHTNALGIPNLQSIPHQLPAGQSGFGRVLIEIPVVSSQMQICDAQPQIFFSAGAPSAPDDLDIPAFLRKQNDDWLDIPKFSITADAADTADTASTSLALSLNQEFTPDSQLTMDEFDISDIEDLGEDEAIIEVLYQLEHAGYNEYKLVAAWLSIYNEFNPNNPLSRHVTRLIKVLCKEFEVSEALINTVRETIKQEIMQPVN